MQRTLSEHISHLEERLASLNKELENPSRTSVERSAIMIDIGIAERSLAHFKKAYELELRLNR
ncbi:MAG TPA: hypothetical protein VMT38_05830 [Terracidiphilus sp.]|nr:hypothetical protein [Terracidiphilus sp.]